MPWMEGRVGPATLSDGTVKEARLDKSGSIVTQDVHGRYYEAVARGNVWTINTPTAGITVTALMVVSSASSNGIVGLYNPTANYNLHIIRAVAVIASQATGTGIVWGTIATTSLLNPLPAGVNRAKNALTFVIGGHRAKVFDGSVAVSGSAATDLYRIMLPASITSALTAAETDGDIIVGPGCFVGIFGDTTTTATVAKASITWEEVPV